MFIVGVTGHRSDRLSADLEPLVRARLREALLTVQHNRLPAECRLVSGLADGADQIAADEALALGWSLKAILPFSAPEYLDHMPSPALRLSLARLLARSVSIALANGETASAPTGSHYERLGEALVDEAHTLLAVWDGRPSDRVGGTYHVVQRARAKPIPVLWVPLDATPARWLE